MGYYGAEFIRKIGKAVGIVLRVDAYMANLERR